ncbi:MAG: phosphoribosyl-AMP cyclohydrolase [Fibrobacteres bacterium CG2_30_45_31]|jgi:phosphoribosyl-AMP cyclohydrolase|nr:MAG: phosphoribosyl-AMP cyclohydrolase [Fibrobacteres bacterium CG2_30_45_31]
MKFAINESLLKELKYDSKGLIPAIVQDADKNDILMMAWMDEEALRRTLNVGEMVFWSRSRKEYWHKGDTSGNVMEVVEWFVDCDADVLLFKVHMHGPQVACHTGARSCFFRKG